MKRIAQVFSLLLATLVLGPFSCQTKVSLHDIQVIGSHNSYKQAIEKPLWDYLYQIDPEVAISLEYEHPTLSEQLNLGLRSLEFDVFHDPDGGRYAHPKGLDIVESSGKSSMPFDPDGALKKPGLKMFHVQDFDFRSHQLLFKEGLQELKTWSDANPDHWPIIILINAKGAKRAGITDPLPFDKEALDRIDFEIKSVFGDEQLITPDLVRGDFSTLEKAILERGWPSLAWAKGRLLFVLDEKEEKIKRYLKNHPSLRNRVLFVNSLEGNPEAGFRIVNDPVKNFAYIRELVANGYMVRTRADANTQEARKNNYERFEKAKASGAQVISTDYYIQTQLFQSDFKVNFGEGVYQRIKNISND